MSGLPLLFSLCGTVRGPKKHPVGNENYGHAAVAATGMEPKRLENILKPFLKPSFFFLIQYISTIT